MDDIDHVLAAGTNLKWTEELASTDELEEKYGYPQIVRVTKDTAAAYNLSENEPVMLVQQRKSVRMIAQSLEEGHYVIGRQIEIPDEFSGLFKISTDYQRNEEEILKTFRSVQEIADAFPPKVYLQEQLTVTLVSDEAAGKFTTIVLQKGDELTIIGRSNSLTGSGLAKPATRFISKVRRTQQNFLVVHWNRIDEDLSLPLSIQGWFSTLPPFLIHMLDHGGVISLRQIMEQANFPLTVIVATNSSRSAKDDFVLRTGMHLKLIGVEEHSVVVGIRPSKQIIEFSPTNLSVLLPSALVSMSGGAQENDKEEISERNLYQTYVQGAYLNSKLQGSSSNLDEHSTAVKFYIPRNKRPTNPKPLNNNACIRQLNVSPLLQRKKLSTSSQGISAIQLLTAPQPDNTMSHGIRSGRRATSLRRQLPTPNASDISLSTNPPLPPRNTLPGLQLSSNYDSSLFSAPPVPPKARPPAPQTLYSAPPNANRPVPSPPPASALPSDMPRRPAPLPNTTDFILNSTSSQPNEFVSENNKDEFESIWEEFIPSSHSPNSNLEQEFSDDMSEKPLLPSARPNDGTVRTDINNTLDEIRSDSPCFSLGVSQHGLTSAGENNSQLYENVTFKIKDQHQDEDEKEDGRYNGLADEDANAIFVEESPIDPVDTTTLSASNAGRMSTEEVAEEALSVKVSALVNGLNLFDDLDVSEEATVTSSRRQSFTKHYVSPPASWQPPDDVTKLTVEELTASLRYIGLSEDIVKAFYNERIDGTFLQELTEDILEEDFHLSKLYRFKIKRFIGGWRPKLSKK